MTKFKSHSKYGTPNYYLPYNILEGIISADEWNKNGVPIQVLND